MTDELPSRRVEVTFVGKPPARQVARASGVAEVKLDGCRLPLALHGPGQLPAILEALRGHEVISLTCPGANCLLRAAHTHIGFPLAGLLPEAEYVAARRGGKLDVSSQRRCTDDRRPALDGLPAVYHRRGAALQKGDRHPQQCLAEDPRTPWLAPPRGIPVDV
ncbi:MAG: hypothetical protein JO023_13110 [Chloroflexi bacterium]|nr:hypothetical protein [Chloroflexota bacterium]